MLTAGVSPGAASRAGRALPAPTFEVRLEEPPQPSAPLFEPREDSPAVRAPAAPPPRGEPRREKPKPAAAPAPTHSARAESSSVLPDSTYYGARQLDLYPVPIAGLEPRFPAGITSLAGGRVVLLVMIDHEGRVDDASVVESEPAGVFDEDARRALLAARFKPAMKDGRQVKSRLLVQLNYGDPGAAR